MARKVRLRNPALKARAAEPEPAAPAEPQPERLPARMREHPYDYRFYQAVRLLNRLLAPREPAGRFASPSEEVARFRSHQTLSFPPSEIRSLEVTEDSPAQMSVNCFGVSGPGGEMPVVFTSYVIERQVHGDQTLAAFLDLFNHRLVSLLYRAWEKHRFQFPYERGESEGLDRYLPHFYGMGTAGLSGRLDVSDESLKFYTGLLSQLPRSASALERLLEDYFEVPVEVVQFVGQWRGLDESAQCRLEDDGEASPASRLGLGAVAGDEVWDPQSTARLRLGPLSLQQYLSFLPGGSAFRPLASLARFFSRGEVDFQVQLVLKRDQAPGVCLGEEGAERPRLGWVSWIKNKPLGRDPEDALFEL
jgi:type VI secretion system protein ImpH